MTPLAPKAACPRKIGVALRYPIDGLSSASLENLNLGVMRI